MKMRKSTIPAARAIGASDGFLGTSRALPEVQALLSLNDFETGSPALMAVEAAYLDGLYAARAAGDMSHRVYLEASAFEQGVVMSAREAKARAGGQHWSTRQAETAFNRVLRQLGVADLEWGDPLKVLIVDAISRGGAYRPAPLSGRAASIRLAS